MPETTSTTTTSTPTPPPPSPTSTPTPPPPPPPAPKAEKPESPLVEIGRYRRRLLSAVSDFGSRQNASGRPIIDGYLRMLNKPPGYSDESNIPIPIRTAVRKPERAANLGGRLSIICHHIGLTMRALQESYGLEKVTPDLRNRTAHLEAALRGWAECKVEGSAPLGFYIGGPDITVRFEEVERGHVPNAKVPKAPVSSNPGGGRGPASTDPVQR